MPDSPTIEPVIQSPPPLPPQPKTNWWKLATILLVLLLAGGGIYLITPRKAPIPTPPVSIQPSPILSPSVYPMMNWQTFTNNQFGISIRYPNDFNTINENSGEGSDFPNTLLAIKKEKSFPGYHLGTRYLFQIQQVPNLKTPASCYIKTNDSSPITKTKIINGNTFYYSDKYGGVAAGTRDINQDYKVFRDIGDICFEIDLRYFESSDWNDPKEFDLAATDQKEAFETLEQILSTFKFTD